MPYLGLDGKDKSSLESKRFLKILVIFLLPFQVTPASSPSTYRTHKHTYLPTQPEKQDSSWPATPIRPRMASTTFFPSVGR